MNPDEYHDTPAGQAPDEEWKWLYHEAFRQYRVLCLWDMSEAEDPSPEAAYAVMRKLRAEGNLEARRLATQLEKTIRP